MDETKNLRSPWSISTTVRNPERLLEFLKILKTLEGEEFNSENQELYQILLIQARLYKPMDIGIRYQKYYENIQEEMPLSVAEEIFKNQQYRDPAMRGRQSVNPLNKLGFAVARKGEGAIRITKLGNLFLNGSYNISYIFLKSLLKLQFPNPWSKDFKETDGFNIMPFISILHLIHKLEQLSNRKGISKEEFSLFVPTLINYEKIDDQVQKIIEYRKCKNKEEKEKFANDYIKEFYGSDNIEEKKNNNLYDYGDNIIRYFTLTKYFQTTSDPLGNHLHINLNPSRLTEIEQLIKLYDGHAIKFTSVKAYMDWMADIDSPELPWEEIDNLQKVVNTLKIYIKDYARGHSITLEPDQKALLECDIAAMDKNQLEEYLNNLRELNALTISNGQKRELRHNKEKLKELIKLFEDKKEVKKLKPTDLEKVVSDALLIIDDEISINPNFLTDDYGQPIFHAPGNKADIECYYNSFNAICEVTMDGSNKQWIRESQPVMRHLKEFKDKHDKQKAICIFIAPKIGTDTYSEFFNSVKHGYDGELQSIVPIDLKQFTIILKKVLETLEKGTEFTNQNLLDLLDRLVNEAKISKGFSEWANNISNALISMYGV